MQQPMVFLLRKLVRLHSWISFSGHPIYQPHDEKLEKLLLQNGTSHQINEHPLVTARSVSKPRRAVRRGIV